MGIHGQLQVAAISARFPWAVSEGGLLAVHVAPNSRSGAKADSRWIISLCSLSWGALRGLGAVRSAFSFFRQSGARQAGDDSGRRGSICAHRVEMALTALNDLYQRVAAAGAGQLPAGAGRGS